MNTETNYVLHFSQIFTVFLIMLGPLRLAGPFSLSTVFLNQNEKRSLSVKAGLYALIALILSGFIGAKIMQSWHLRPATLLLAVGILFLIAAVHPLLHSTDNTIEPRIPPDPVNVAMKLIISPHGLAAVVVLFALSHDRSRLFTIIGALSAIIFLDVLMMAFNKSDAQKHQSLFSQLLKTLLGTLQFALSLQLIYLGLKNLGVI